MLNPHHNHDASDRTTSYPAHRRDWRQRNEDLVDKIRSDLAAGHEMKRILRSITQLRLDAVIFYDDIRNLAQQRQAMLKQGLTTIEVMIQELGEGPEYQYRYTVDDHEQAQSKMIDEG